MENKGLCITCVYDADCCFKRTFPVVHCEEFSDIKSGVKKENKNQEQKEVRFDTDEKD